MLTSAEYFWGFSNDATKEESRSGSGIVSFVFADLAVLVLAVAAEKKLLKVLILLAKIHPSFDFDGSWSFLNKNENEFHC